MRQPKVGCVSMIRIAWVFTDHTAARQQEGTKQAVNLKGIWRIAQFDIMY
jgi:hypothetical protein